MLNTKELLAKLGVLQRTLGPVKRALLHVVTFTYCPGNADFIWILKCKFYLQLCSQNSFRSVFPPFLLIDMQIRVHAEEKSCSKVWSLLPQKVKPEPID